MSLEPVENATATSFEVTARYRKIVLLILFLVGLFNYADRFMLAVLLPDIKADLDLSDTQIGFITGIGFALFYAVCGIPIARLADRYSRRVIISTVVTIWSVMTAIGGLSQSFLQLTVARILVGVGESGATPSSQSLIADTRGMRNMEGKKCERWLRRGVDIVKWALDFWAWTSLLESEHLRG